MILAIFIYFVAVAAIAAGVTFTIARRRFLLDHPNARSSHQSAVPRAGGLGIIAATVIGIVALWLDGHPTVLRDPAFMAVLAGGLVAAAGGLSDDIRARSSTVKLGVQIVAAYVAISLGLKIEAIYVPGFGAVTFGMFATPVTLLWLVALTNTYNFMDGIDGLAGGTAVIGFGFLMFVALGVSQVDESTLPCTLAAASLGFLLFNLPPARIFMGDVGSQFLGFAFAALSVLIARHDASGTLAWAVPLVLFHFIFDTLFTAYRRWRRSEKLTQAHRSHLYQRLTHAGFGHGRTTALLCAMGVLQGVGALWMTRAPEPARLLVFVPALLIQIGYAVYVTRREAR
jgi:UDP-N-acetylmuramyl pentapeptide phosphotransferase/UDP-N-acetylglucosamine-1-phosphate transferase